MVWYLNPARRQRLGEMRHGLGAPFLLLLLGVLHGCSCELSARTSSAVDEKAKAEATSRGRVRRGWVWNQFFVVEEYTGTEPLYVGKVGSSPPLRVTLGRLAVATTPENLCGGRHHRTCAKLPRPSVYLHRFA
ncbi:hypothetical protein GN956_G17360 [Arapaima gigas]